LGDEGAEHLNHGAFPFQFGSILNQMMIVFSMVDVFGGFLVYLFLLLNILGRQVSCDDTVNIFRSPLDLPVLDQRDRKFTGRRNERSAIDSASPDSIIREFGWGDKVVVDFRDCHPGSVSHNRGIHVNRIDRIARNEDETAGTKLKLTIGMIMVL
jgi:hypothetical protein